MKNFKNFILMTSIISFSAFAASDLVKEFTKRRSIVQSLEIKKVYRFLKNQGKAPHDLKELEMLNSYGKFAVRFKNDDVCFGDTESESIECFNAVGFRTYFAAGDSD